MQRVTFTATVSTPFADSRAAPTIHHDGPVGPVYKVQLMCYAFGTCSEICGL